MTPNAPTWAGVRKFLEADGWRELPSNEKGGSQTDHIHFEKVLDDGTVLKTHISHSKDKSPGPQTFPYILNLQLKVSRKEFWQCISSGEPVPRPAQVEEAPKFQHDAWVVAALKSNLHLSDEDINELDPEKAKQLVYDSWGTGPQAG